MVGDGMGFSFVTAARLAKGGVDGPPLALETLERFGYQRTYSANGVIADSAATASAWACGAKFQNGAPVPPRRRPPAPPSLLDLARESGRAVGLVATSTITHATPAAFGASVPDRACEAEIARQYLVDSKVDLLLGGGLAHFRSATKDPCGGGGADYVRAGEARGLFGRDHGRGAESGRRDREAPRALRRRGDDARPGPPLGLDRADARRDDRGRPGPARAGTNRASS